MNLSKIQLRFFVEDLREIRLVIFLDWMSTANKSIKRNKQLPALSVSIEISVYLRQHGFLGALNLQDLKMTDQKRSKTGKCRTWKMTDRNAGRWQIITETKSKFWLWKIPTSNIMKILLLVHSAVNLLGRKIRIVCFSQTWNITSRHGRVVRLALRHTCILAYTHSY